MFLFTKLIYMTIIRRPYHLPSTEFCVAPAAPPKVLHYGLIYTVPNSTYTFDKHWHYDFDATACPPWDLNTDHPKKGMFPHPPRALSFKTKVDLNCACKA